MSIAITALGVKQILCYLINFFILSNGLALLHCSACRRRSGRRIPLPHPPPPTPAEAAAVPLGHRRRTGRRWPRVRYIGHNAAAAQHRPALRAVASRGRARSRRRRSADAALPPLLRRLLRAAVVGDVRREVQLPCLLPAPHQRLAGAHGRVVVVGAGHHRRRLALQHHAAVYWLSFF